MSEAYKLATVCIGDTIIYRSDTGRRAVGRVRGWKTTPGSGQRYVLVEGRAISLQNVLERHRFGASAIIFDEQLEPAQESREQYA